METDFSILPPDGVLIPAFSGSVDGWPETQHRGSATVGTVRLETGASVADHAEADPNELTLEGWASGLTLGVEVPSNLDVVRELSQPAKPNASNPIVMAAIESVRNRALAETGGAEVVALIEDVMSETEASDPDSQRLEVLFRNLKGAVHVIPDTAFPTGPISLGVEALEAALVRAPGIAEPVVEAALPQAPSVPTLAGERHTLRGVWAVVQRLLSTSIPVRIQTAVMHYDEMILTSANLLQDNARFQLRFLEIRRASVIQQNVADPAATIGPAVGRGALQQVGRPTVSAVSE